MAAACLEDSAVPVIAIDLSEQDLLRHRQELLAEKRPSSAR
jgi:hypothetical protein